MSHEAKGWVSVGCFSIKERGVDSTAATVESCHSQCQKSDKDYLLIAPASADTAILSFTIFCWCQPPDYSSATTVNQTNCPMSCPMDIPFTSCGGFASDGTRYWSGWSSNITATLPSSLSISQSPDITTTIIATIAILSTFIILLFIVKCYRQYRTNKYQDDHQYSLRSNNERTPKIVSISSWVQLNRPHKSSHDPYSATTAISTANLQYRSPSSPTSNRTIISTATTPGRVSIGARTITARSEMTAISLVSTPVLGIMPDGFLENESWDDLAISMESSAFPEGVHSDAAEKEGLGIDLESGSVDSQVGEDEGQDSRASSSLYMDVFARNVAMDSG
ncbi:hypothetical protein BDR26DRAFT_894953 [Obelidium mucronatum]|nr:hypothetical protein BDR26DRAFT_894953 [Obelidium mucronatum]